MKLMTLLHIRKDKDPITNKTEWVVSYSSPHDIVNGFQIGIYSTKREALKWAPIRFKYHYNNSFYGRLKAQFISDIHKTYWDKVYYINGYDKKFEELEYYDYKGKSDERIANDLLNGKEVFFRYSTSPMQQNVYKYLIFTKQIKELK